MEIANPNDNKIKDISVKNPMGVDCNTLIFMKDHSSKAIGSLQIGDELLLGGKVTNIIKDKSSDIYNYKGLFCTGTMKVFEDGRWMKVEESSAPRRLTNEDSAEICIIQSEVMLMLSSDYQAWSTNLKDVTVELNTKHELNALLANSLKGLK